MKAKQIILGAVAIAAVLWIGKKHRTHYQSYYSNGTWYITKAEWIGNMWSYSEYGKMTNEEYEIFKKNHEVMQAI